jgi:hypothetical protein
VSERQLELAQQLRALHLPEPVGFWPLAPGWWILAALLLLGAGYGLLSLLRHRRRRSLAGQCEQLLLRAYSNWQSSGTTDDYLLELASVLRRVALAKDQRAQVARLSGVEWTQWLVQASANPLQDASRQMLASGLYQPSVAELDVSALHRDLLRWARGLHA